MANVLIAFPGASSADVQNMVARPAEQVLSQIAGIEHTYSVVAPRHGRADGAVQGRRAAHRGAGAPVRRAQRQPGLAARAAWARCRRSSGPRASTTCRCWPSRCGAATAPARVELERVAHAMEAELKRVPGTREVQTIGGPGRAVQVTLEPERLRERGIDLLRLKQTLAAANQAMPAGTVIDDAGAGATRSLAVETGEFLRSAAGRGRPRRRRAPGQAGLPARGGRRSRPARRSPRATSGSRRAPARRPSAPRLPAAADGAATRP